MHTNTNAADWATYYALTKDKPPSLLLQQALHFLIQRNDALDLGCGAGRDTKFLLEQGFRVTAVDQNEEALKHLLRFPQQRLQMICSPYEKFHFGRYDLVNAQYALPFTAKEMFHAVFTRMQQAIKTGGIFTGQLFGINDESNRSDSSLNFFTRQQVVDLLGDMEQRVFIEEEADGPTAQGVCRHWHVFHLIAQKPALPPTVF